APADQHLPSRRAAPVARSRPRTCRCARRGRRPVPRPANPGRRMSDELIQSTAADLAARIAAREVSAVEVAQAHLDRIAAVDDRVHAFLHADTDGALAQAARVDSGEVSGPLAGVPLALKDVIVTRGVPTTAGSRI